jgi:hypothetical protein
LDYTTAAFAICVFTVTPFQKVGAMFWNVGIPGLALPAKKAQSGWFVRSAYSEPETIAF